MAKFKPYRVTSSQLNSLPIVDGQYIVVTDTNQVYVDLNNNTRKLLKEELTNEDIIAALGYTPLQFVQVETW